jgi:DNA adenine methylase
MWRHNSDGKFNVGYGGQDRRWVISRRSLVEASNQLRHARLVCADFEEVIDGCSEGDFLFLDPPYRPGGRDMLHDHYGFGKFTFDDHRRLAAALLRASARKVRWAMTTSAHPSVVSLFRTCHIVDIPKGTGRHIGSLVLNSGEVLIRNYMEKRP